MAGGRGDDAWGSNDARKSAREVLEERDYQQDLPRTPDEPDMGRLATILEVLGWILLAAVLVIMGLGIANALRNRRRRPSGGKTTVESAPDSAPEVILPDYVILARDGRFTDAIHALLLRALGLLGRDAALAPGTTSREIIRETRIANDARRDLSGLVLAVEVSLFGGRETGESEYRKSLATFESFRKAFGGVHS